ncbi:MAG TPA: GFA family protein [Gammaproteobacteria bacterium]
MSSYEGGCACGAVRYRLESEPMFVHCCHCRDCQRQTGSAFVLNALIETDRVVLLSGELTVHTMPTDSGRPHDVYRCATCGTAVWSDYGRRRYLRFVRVGTLDEPDAIAPDVHIYTRSKLPWVRLPEGARAFEAYYHMKTEWPPESQTRRERAAGKA